MLTTSYTKQIKKISSGEFFQVVRIQNNMDKSLLLLLWTLFTNKMFY